MNIGLPAPLDCLFSRNARNLVHRSRPIFLRIRRRRRESVLDIECTVRQLGSVILSLFIINLKNGADSRLTPLHA